MNFRIGFGFDVHQLKNGEEFIIGGVKITHHKGPTGHSDADALIHSICDALLGAANLGDIGHHFPDNSAEYKNIDSSIFQQTYKDVGYDNFQKYLDENGANIISMLRTRRNSSL